MRKSRSRFLRAAVLAAAALSRQVDGSLFGNRNPQVASSDETAGQPLVFFGIADWGGQEIAPYTTAGQLAVADAMGVLALEAGNHPAFIVAAGDNFYMDGLPGESASWDGLLRVLLAICGWLDAEIRRL